MKTEYTQRNDIYYNFVLDSYKPVNSTLNKYTNTMILYKSIENTANEIKILNIIIKLRQLLGKNQVVWGIKNINNEISYELYFYQKYNHKLVSIKNIINQLKEDFEIFNFNEINSLNSIMFSFDFFKDKNKIDEINVYFSQYIKHNLHTKSFSINKNYEKEFQNYYITYNQSEQKEIIQTILTSPYNIDTKNLPDILIPELMKCEQIYIGSKRNCNGIYFQGVDITQLIFFLKKFKFDLALIEFIEKNKENLDYLLFDISFDYYIKNNKFIIKKSGFYGTF